MTAYTQCHELCLLSTVPLPSFALAMSTYHLNCWCIDSESNDVNMIQISPSESISSLKNAIANAFLWKSDLPASAAALWKVSIPVGNFESYMYISDRGWKTLDRDSPEYLSPVFSSLTDDMPQLPKDNHLHIIVKPPFKPPAKNSESIHL